MKTVTPFECSCKCAPSCTAGCPLCRGGLHRELFAPKCHPGAVAQTVVEGTVLSLVCGACDAPIAHLDGNAVRYDLIRSNGWVASCLLDYHPRADQVDHGDHETRLAHDRAGNHAKLTPREKAWGCARPYRHSYRHVACGHVTTFRFGEMAMAVARHGHRDPSDPQSHSMHRKGLWCSSCNELLPPGDFVWIDSRGRDLGKVGA